MPEPVPGAAQPSPQQPPGASASQQPPFGASPATGPTPNKGMEVAVKQRLGLIVRQLGELVAMAGPTEIGKGVVDMLKIGMKHVQPGEVSPAAEKNTIEQMLLKNAQNGQQMQQMKAQGAGGAAPPQGMPAPGASPQMPRAA